MKKLIPALCLLLVTAVLMGTSTFAWFSMNTTVNATGMQVNATASGALAIQNDASKLGSDFGTNVTVAFTEGDKGANLVPATHMAIDSTYTYGLAVLNNPTDVSIATGLAKEGKTLTAATAASTSSFVDYVVYLAALDEALENKTLSVKMTDVSTVGDTQKALSVDFYVATNTTDLGTYAGKINAVNAASQTTDLTGSYTFPVAKTTGTSNVVKVTMRVYFDGALTYNSYVKATGKFVAGTTYYTDATGTTQVNTSTFEAGVTDVTSYYVFDKELAYVRSDLVTTADITFGVQFSLK